MDGSNEGKLDEFVNRTTRVLETVLREIVDNPDKVELRIRRGEQTIVFEVCTTKLDLGKVIGKQGSMAAALRKILQAIAAKYGQRSILEIIE